MKRRTTKLFSALLAACMLTGLFAVPVLAEETVAAETETQEAVAESAETTADPVTEEAETAVDEVLADQEEAVPADVTEEQTAENISVPEETPDTEDAEQEEALEETALEKDLQVKLQEDPDGWFMEDSKTFYYVEGAFLTGFQKIEGNTYYFNKKGVMLTGLQRINSKTYYFNEKGVMQTGLQTVNDKVYFFTKNGPAKTGWKTISGKRYYFGKKGAAVTGFKKINGKKMYFNEKGVRQTGWTKVGKDWYFFHKTNGKMYTGSKMIKSVMYHFKKSGVCLDKDKNSYISKYMTKKAKNYSSPTQYLIMVDCRRNRMGIYEGYKGHWEQIKFIPCSTGSGGSETVKGVYHIEGNRGYSFGTDHYTCYWYSGFYGGYLMHSIKYKPGTMKVKDGRLGRSISGGCVRLAIENAKWIYDNCPIGTTVVTFKSE